MLRSMYIRAPSFFLDQFTIQSSHESKYDYPTDFLDLRQHDNAARFSEPRYRQFQSIVSRDGEKVYTVNSGRFKVWIDFLELDNPLKKSPPPAALLRSPTQRDSQTQPSEISFPSPSISTADGYSSPRSTERSHSHWTGPYTTTQYTTSSTHQAPSASPSQSR